MNLRLTLDSDKQIGGFSILNISLNVCAGSDVRFATPERESEGFATALRAEKSAEHRGGSKSDLASVKEAPPRICL